MLAYSIPMLLRPFIVCPSVSTISKISKTAWPMIVKFYVEPR